MARISALITTTNPLLPNIALSQEGKLYEVRVEPYGQNPVKFRVRLIEMEQVEETLPPSPPIE